MTVLILAAGAGTRWSFGKPKQLLSIKGEPLLLRTIRQVKARGYQPIIVAINQELTAISEHHFKPEKHRWTVETLLSTQSLWDSPVKVLLGDVIYSKSAMDTILSDLASLKYFLVRKKFRQFEVNEVVGLSFLSTSFQAVLEGCSISINTAVEGKKTKEALLQHLMHSHPHGSFQKMYLGDWTQDFDRLEEYQNFDMTQADEMLDSGN